MCDKVLFKIANLYPFAHKISFSQFSKIQTIIIVILLVGTNYYDGCFKYFFFVSFFLLYPLYIYQYMYNRKEAIGWLDFIPFMSEWLCFSIVLVLVVVYVAW